MSNFYLKRLQRIDKEKRNEWNAFYAYSNHQEDELKNHLICEIHKTYPRFKYLIDFEWEVKEGHPNRGKGDLIFGSDDKIYLVVETKYLSTSGGRTARVARHNARHKVKEQAKKYIQEATKRFEGVKVIGCTFTNEGIIHFFDDNDKRIATSVAGGEKD